MAYLIGTMDNYEREKQVEAKFTDFYLALKEHDSGKAILMADLWVSLKLKD